MNLRARTAPVLFTLALTVVLAGCDLIRSPEVPSGQRQPAQPVPEGEAPAVAQTPGASEGAAEAAPEADAQAAAPPGAPIASRDLDSQNTTLHVEIASLRRRDNLVMLEWTIANTGTEAWDMSSNMGDTAAGLGLTVGGVSLVDPTNSQRYRVARMGDPESPRCLCSDYDVSTDVGETVRLQATFAAPPPELNVITVDMPPVGIFNDVPIS